VAQGFRVYEKDLAAAKRSFTPEDGAILGQPLVEYLE
jgi:hypothetical protein